MSLRDEGVQRWRNEVWMVVYLSPSSFLSSPTHLLLFSLPLCTSCDFYLSLSLSPHPLPPMNTCIYRTLLKYSPTSSTALLLLSAAQKVLERLESDPSSVGGEEIPSAHNISTMAASTCHPGRTTFVKVKDSTLTMHTFG